MKTAAIYVKYKANAQCSVESKIDQCVEFANSNGLEVVEVYCERITDSKQKRFELERLLADSKQRKFECVIVPSVNNLTRKFYEFKKVYQTLKKKNISLLTVMNEKITILERMGLWV